MPLVHHELCFGCGRVNLFGLLLEVEQPAPPSLSGRCFLKQDHQGPDRGRAHPGIVATALIEAMELLAGPAQTLEDFHIQWSATAPTGAFLTVQAQLDAPGTLSATASSGGDQLATARGTLKTCQRA